MQEPSRKYSRDNRRNGGHSVDEASELLGIPRPTLYRYLREYSISHVRKSGRIVIPEDSLQRIRQVRDLHREGMGTGSVRRALREQESQSSDASEISLRLEKLSSDLEGLRVDPVRKSGGEDLSSAQALRTILARQSLLISAVFNLTEMFEEMMRSSGYQPRRSLSDALRESDAGSDSGNLRLLSDTREIPAQTPAEARNSATESGAGDARTARPTKPVSSGDRNRPAIRLSNLPSASQTVTPEETHSDRRVRSGFGTLARRRRNLALSVTLILLVCAALLVYALWLA